METGKKQNIEFILTNYNETYQTSVYNGQEAIGTVDLLIEGEIVNTWSYSIKPNDSQIFNFEWLSIAGLRHFEVIAYVPDGEIIVDNNNLSVSASFKSEKKTGLIPSPNLPIALISIAVVALCMRRKPN